MSGGSLDYFYYKLEKHIGDFNDKELDELVKDLAQLFHDREWYLSGDYGESKWHETRDNFKQKWFGEGTRQERPTGEWIKTDNRWGIGLWRCSYCDSFYDVKTNYCPTCGAKMKGDK